MIHPFFHLQTRIETRFALKRAGYSFSQVNDAIEILDPDTIEMYASAAGIAIPDFAAQTAEGATGKIGDGSILAAIIAFFKSPQGQALLAFIMKMLISLIAGL